MTIKPHPRRKRSHLADGVFIDDLDKHEEGNFEHRDRLYVLFRMICEDENQLHEVAEKMGCPEQAYDGTVYFMSSGKRTDLVRIGATEIDDKTMTCMIFNLWCGDRMGDATTCWKHARERHCRIDSVREQKRSRDEARQKVDEAKQDRDERRRAILDKAVELHESTVADEQKKQGEEDQGDDEQEEQGPTLRRIGKSHPGRRFPAADDGE